jgi:hypothetical protein
MQGFLLQGLNLVQFSTADKWKEGGDKRQGERPLRDSSRVNRESMHPPLWQFVDNTIAICDSGKRGNEAAVAFF